MGRQSEWQTFDRILWIFGQSASRWHCTCRLRFWYKGISWFLLCNTQNFCIYKAQLTGIEVEQTRRIANVCIHVERVIGNLWQKYSLLFCNCWRWRNSLYLRLNCLCCMSVDKHVWLCCAIWVSLFIISWVFSVIPQVIHTHTRT